MATQEHRGSNAVSTGGPSRRTLLRGIAGSGVAALAGAGLPSGTLAQTSGPSSAADPPAETINLVALYGTPTDPVAFERYYQETHVPLALSIPHLAAGETAVVLAGADGSPAPFYRFARLSFASMEDLQAATGSPEGEATIADLANFATGGVTVFIATIDRTYSAENFAIRPQTEVAPAPPA